MQDVPTKLVINGFEYIRKDCIVGVDEELERSYSGSELSKNTGFPRSTIYDAVSRGELQAVMPNGTMRGMRIMRSAWQRFILSRTS